ncbi:uncharacterized protein [Diadema setosum]|uniref:uncharacterized protein n=1 Tax=Diadema setosum TaxID=31175 RepID=UPI003B3B02A0
MAQDKIIIKQGSLQMQEKEQSAQSEECYCTAVKDRSTSGGRVKLGITLEHTMLRKTVKDVSISKRGNILCVRGGDEKITFLRARNRQECMDWFYALSGEPAPRPTHRSCPVAPPVPTPGAERSVQSGLAVPSAIFQQQLSDIRARGDKLRSPEIDSYDQDGSEAYLNVDFNITLTETRDAYKDLHDLNELMRAAGKGGHPNETSRTYQDAELEEDNYYMTPATSQGDQYGTDAVATGDESRSEVDNLQESLQEKLKIALQQAGLLKSQEPEQPLYEEPTDSTTEDFGPRRPVPKGEETSGERDWRREPRLPVYDTKLATNQQSARSSEGNYVTRRGSARTRWTGPKPQDQEKVEEAIYGNIGVHAAGNHVAATPSNLESPPQLPRPSAKPAVRPKPTHAAEPAAPSAPVPPKRTLSARLTKPSSPASVRRTATFPGIRAGEPVPELYENVDRRRGSTSQSRSTGPCEAPSLSRRPPLLPPNLEQCEGSGPPPLPPPNLQKVEESRRPPLPPPNRRQSEVSERPPLPPPNRGHEVSERPPLPPPNCGESELPSRRPPLPPPNHRKSEASGRPPVPPPKHAQGVVLGELSERLSAQHQKANKQPKRSVFK